jgi:hypothetical protein
MLEMRRREFIVGLGGAAGMGRSRRAQQDTRVRRIGVLMGLDENDPEGKRRYSAFTQALADLGWTDGRNVQMDLRWGGDDNNRIRATLSRLKPVGQDDGNSAWLGWREKDGAQAGYLPSRRGAIASVKHRRGLMASPR